MSDNNKNAFGLDEIESMLSDEDRDNEAGTQEFDGADNSDIEEDGEYKEEGGYGESEKTNGYTDGRKRFSKRLIDIITIVLLAASFILAFYTGFVGKAYDGAPMLKTGILALIGIGGTIMLFAMGGLSQLILAAKHGVLTKKLNALIAIQVCAIATMIAVMAALLTELFTVDNTLMRVLFLICSLFSVAGYSDSVLFSDALEKKLELEAAAAEENDGDPEEGEYSEDEAFSEHGEDFEKDFDSDYEDDSGDGSDGNGDNAL